MPRTSVLGLLIVTLFFTACSEAPPTASNQDADRQQFISSPEPMPEFSTTVLEAELASPRKEMKGNLNGVNIIVNYGSPACKGRALWNSLIPYGEVWRTGANEATRITVDQPVKIGEADLPAGTYGLFTIPNEEEWEVIFNSQAEQWGAYEYDSGKDILRYTVEPRTKPDTTEMLAFSLGRNALVLEWGQLRLPIPIAGQE